MDFPADSLVSRAARLLEETPRVTDDAELISAATRKLIATMAGYVDRMSEQDVAVYQRERDRRLQWRLSMVNEAGRRIGTTLDIARTAQELADLATENFADLVTVDLLDSVLRENDGPVSGLPTLRRVAQRSVVEGDPESTIRPEQLHVSIGTSAPTASGGAAGAVAPPVSTGHGMPAGPGSNGLLTRSRVPELWQPGTTREPTSSTARSPSPRSGYGCAGNRRTVHSPPRSEANGQLQSGPLAPRGHLLNFAPAGTPSGGLTHSTDSIVLSLEYPKLLGVSRSAIRTDGGGTCVMRRMATALGTLGVAMALVLTVSNSAYAAQGVLVIDGVAHEDPSGCFPLADFVPPVVSNYTDAIVEVHSGADCTGQVTRLIYPGETYHPNGSKSVFVL